MNNHQPLFTIEQIELIRRLRNSGITKQQVVDAFDSLSRIDHELGTLYTVPQNLGVKRRPLTPEVCQSARASSSTEVQIVKRPRRDSREDDGCLGDDLEGLGSLGAVTSGIDEDLKGRLDEFMRVPPSKRLDDIQNLIMDTGITPDSIAAKTGLLVSTISHYLDGGTTEISSNQRRSIYIWYLRLLQRNGSSSYSKTMANLKCLRRMSQSLVKSPTQPVMQILPNASETKDMDDLLEEHNFNTNFTFVQTSLPQRRERFTFQKKHLDILEESFLENQYPCTDEREQIAARCNAAIKAMSRRELMERERVNIAIVSNWYNNKRKDLKRLAKEDKTGGSDVAFPNKFARLKPLTGSGFSLSQVNSTGNSNSQSSDVASISNILSAWNQDDTVDIKQEPSEDSSNGTDS